MLVSGSIFGGHQKFSVRTKKSCHGRHGLSFSVQMSHEKNPGYLGCIGDYTTQLYTDYKKP